MEKKRKIVKGKVEILNERRESSKMMRGLFFFPIFKTTKICFAATKMEIFYREKAIRAGKRIRKNDFAPSENFPVTPLHGTLLMH